MLQRHLRPPSVQVANGLMYVLQRLQRTMPVPVCEAFLSGVVCLLLVIIVVGFDREAYVSRDW